MTSASHNESVGPTPVADPALDAWIQRGREAPLPDVSADWDALRDVLSTEDRGLSRLRSWPTRVRLAVLFGFFAFVITTVLFVTGRADFDVLPTTRFVADILLLAAPLVFAVLAAMYPVHRPELARSLRWAAIILAVLAVGSSVSLPPAHLEHPASLEGVGDDFVARAFKCFMFGTVVAVPALVVLRLLGRTGKGVRRFVPSILVTAVVVLVGVLGLYMHCPITASSHLAAGHMTVWVPFVVLALVLGRAAADD